MVSVVLQVCTGLLVVAVLFLETKAFAIEKVGNPGHVSPDMMALESYMRDSKYSTADGDDSNMYNTDFLASDDDHLATKRSDRHHFANNFARNLYLSSKRSSPVEKRASFDDLIAKLTAMSGNRSIYRFPARPLRFGPAGKK
jgi:hypothetical protein